jgi:hypothetical protein
MKLLKVSLLSVLFATVALVGSAFKAENTPAPAAKKFAQVSYEWTNATLFEIGVSSSSLIGNTGNWDLGSSTPVGGSEALSRIVASYTTTQPTESQIITALQNEYENLEGANQLGLLVDTYSFQRTINSETVTFVVRLQDIP